MKVVIEYKNNDIEELYKITHWEYDNKTNTVIFFIHDEKYFIEEREAVLKINIIEEF